MTVEEGLVEGKKYQRSVLVGIRLDANGRELLSWALAKIAGSGDLVVAVHVCRVPDLPSEENGSNLSLNKSLDGYLAVYEGFCNVKKLDLVGRISYGNSIRKTLIKEAKACSATAVLVGISKHNALGVSLSLARYCAKMLPPTTSVLAVHNGKIIFQRDAMEQHSGPQIVRRTTLHSLLYPSLNMECIPGCIDKPDAKVSDIGNTFGQLIHYSDGGSAEGDTDTKDITIEKKATMEDNWMKANETERGSSSSAGNTLEIELKPSENEAGSSSSARNIVEIESSSDIVEANQDHLANDVASSSITLLVKKIPEPTPGWPLLRRAVTAGSETQRYTGARDMSVVQWVMNLPTRSVNQTPEHQFGLRKADDLSGKESLDCLHRRTRSCSDPLLDLPKEFDTLLITNSSSCRLFTLKELCSFTSQFSPENLIGKGGSGRVYKGCLPSGETVAVKIMKSSEEAWRDFLLETNIITSLQHKHILPLIGVSIEDNELISVYPLSIRGSLEENLHCGRAKLVLPWEVRFKMAIGIAEALSYLHGCSRPVIHRDVKSSNILLSDDLEPQLSDFGLAIWAPTTSTCVTHSDVVGTFGYLAPEYFMYGKVSEKIDVYSYGVLLLELLSGRKPISNEKPKGQESLVMWATPLLEKGDPKDLLDPNLSEAFNENQVRRMILAASLCITRTARLRPRMNQIVKLLQGNEDLSEWVKTHLNLPKESDNQDEEEYPASNQYHNLSLSLLDEDDDTTSISSVEPSTRHSLEDYLKGRYSRSSSFD